MAPRKLMFPGHDGTNLAARLDLPDQPALAMALFAHCFTCTKDIYAANQIAKRLTELGIGVLRFDFTGLGASEGEFENTNFSSNVADLIAAADFMGKENMAPSLLIGHSLGGAAVLKAARHIKSLKAVATLAAPFDPGHVEHNFDAWVQKIEADGEAEVMLVGRPFKVKKQFLDDIRGQSIAEDVSAMRVPLMIMHAPLDQTVGINNAQRIFEMAKHPKSFYSLDSADHLLSKRQDAIYAADTIAIWASRYLDVVPGRPPQAELPEYPDGDTGAAIMAERGIGPYTVDGVVSGHAFTADEPRKLGGNDLGPGPYELMKAALGACTIITMRMYADRKSWPVESIQTTVQHEKVDGTDHFTRKIAVTGDLDAEQRARMLEIAEKCPVHRTITNGGVVKTNWMD